MWGGAAANLIYRACIRDCEFDQMQGWGIYVDEAPRGGVPQFSVWAIYQNLEIHDTIAGGGIYIGGNGTTAQSFENCTIKNCGGSAVTSSGGQGLSFLDCTFESNIGPEMSLMNCLTVAARSCWFQDALGPGQFFVVADGEHRGLTLDACTFRQVATAADPGGNDLGAVRIAGYGRAVVVRGCEFLLAHGALANGAGTGQIVIDAPSNPSNPSEVLIMDCCATDVLGPQAPRIQDGSTRTALVNTAGRIRLPRLDATAIAGLLNVSAGDMVFNTTLNKAVLFDGTTWQPLW